MCGHVNSHILLSLCSGTYSSGQSHPTELSRWIACRWWGFWRWTGQQSGFRCCSWPISWCPRLWFRSDGDRVFVVGSPLPFGYGQRSYCCVSCVCGWQTVCSFLWRLYNLARVFRILCRSLHARWGRLGRWRVRRGGCGYVLLCRWLSSWPCLKNGREGGLRGVGQIGQKGPTRPARRSRIHDYVLVVGFMTVFAKW